MEVFIWSIGCGIIGMGYFSIGKKRDLPSFMYSGIALMIFPYFIGGLSITPFVLKQFNTN